VRADAEFLTSDGELMVRVGQGMGSDVSLHHRKDRDSDEDELEVVKPRTLDKGKGKDMSYFGIDNGKGEQTTPRVWIGDFSGGGWMDEVVETKAQTQTSFEAKLEAGVATAMAGGGAKMETKMERKAITFGEEIRASGKAKELSRWWDKEKGEWGEIEVIELSDDED
jgi:hypothetical protein